MLDQLTNSPAGNWVGGGLLLGAIAASWNYLKAWMTRIVRLLVCQAEIKDAELTGMLMAEFLTHGRQTTGGRRTIDAYTLSDKRNGRKFRVPGDILNAESKLILYRGTLLLVSRRRNGDSNQNAPASVAEMQLTISWLRWTLNLDELLLRVTTEWRVDGLEMTKAQSSPVYTKLTDGQLMANKAHVHCRIVKRKKLGGNGYRIISHTGTVGRTGTASVGIQGGGGMLPATTQAVDPTCDLRYSDFQPIGFPREFVGEPEPKNPAACFAMTPTLRAVMTDCERWLSAREFCEERGLAWRRGWLFHGVAGSGKSTTVRLVAQTYKLPVHRIFLGTMRTSEFLDAWDRLQGDAPCIALLEDIDAVFHGRDNVVNAAEGVTFDALLNEVAGVKAANGVLLAVTTNHLAHIDEALGQPLDCMATCGNTTRPGRIDRAFWLPEPTFEERLELGRKILDGLVADAEIEKMAMAFDGKSITIFHQAICERASQAFWEKLEEA